MHLSSIVCKKIAAMKHVLQNKDLQTALLILRSLIFNTSPIHVQPAPFDFVHVLKDALRKDIVWYIWDFFLWEAKESDNTDLHEYVRQALMIYLHGYAKKQQPIRLNLLVFVMSALAQKQVKNKVVLADIIKAASKKIHIVFGEVLGQDLPRTEYLSCYVNSGSP
jgi:hypothetical protein